MSDAIASCPKCQSPVHAGARFCEHCGHQLAPVAAADVSPAEVPGATESGPAEREQGEAGGKKRRRGSASGDALTWDFGMPLVTNPYFLWDGLQVLVITAVVAELIVALMGLIVNGEPLFLPPIFIAIPLGVIVFLALPLTVLLYSNRFNATFTIDGQQARVVAGRKERKINRAVLILSLFVGRGRALGPALLAYSQEETSIEWRDVHKVTVHPRSRVITLNNSWRTVLRLYCPPELFEEVVERVQAAAARGARLRAAAQAGRRPRRTSFAWIGPWIVLTVAATVASLVWDSNETPTFALVAGGLVLVSGLVDEDPPRRALALLGALASLGALANLASLAFQGTTYVPGLSGLTVYGYERQTSMLAVAVIGGLALLAMSLVRLLGRSPASTKDGSDAEAQVDG